MGAALESLQMRKKYLLDIKREKEKALQNVPQGTLRVSAERGGVKYYHRKHPKDVNGTYIRDGDLDFAKRLAQKNYDTKVLKSVIKEIKAINNYLSNYPTTNAEGIIENLHKERRKLVHPIHESNEVFLEEWEAKEYKGKDFHENTAEHYTAKGERVRSKSEILIADMLFRENIPYRYEYPLYLKGFGIVYPDFTALNLKNRQEIIWDHFGMMDEPEYAEKAVRKIATYDKNGFYPGKNLILTFESKNNPINQKQLNNIIYQYLKNN